MCDCSDHSVVKRVVYYEADSETSEEEVMALPEIEYEETGIQCNMKFKTFHKLMQTDSIPEENWAASGLQRMIHPADDAEEGHFHMQGKIPQPSFKTQLYHHHCMSVHIAPVFGDDLPNEDYQMFRPYDIHCVPSHDHEEAPCLNMRETVYYFKEEEKPEVFAAPEYEEYYATTSEEEYIEYETVYHERRVPKYDHHTEIVYHNIPHHHHTEVVQQTVTKVCVDHAPKK